MSMKPVAQVVALEPEGPDGHGVNWLAGKRPAPGALLFEEPRWIPVSASLPPEHVTCAVRMDGDYIAIAWSAYWHGARTDFARWVFPHDSDKECADKVTHWLALPPLPVVTPNAD